MECISDNGQSIRILFFIDSIKFFRQKIDASIQGVSHIRIQTESVFQHTNDDKGCHGDRIGLDARIDNVARLPISPIRSLSFDQPIYSSADDTLVNINERLRLSESGHCQSCYPNGTATIV